MTNEDRYCKQCKVQIEPYLGQEDIYHCELCDRSYERKDTFDIRQKLGSTYHPAYIWDTIMRAKETGESEV